MEENKDNDSWRVLGELTQFMRLARKESGMTLREVHAVSGMPIKVIHSAETSGKVTLQSFAKLCAIYRKMPFK